MNQEGYCFAGVECPELRPVPYCMYYQNSSLDYSSTVTYYCNEGFSVIDHSPLKEITVSCMGDGSWSEHILGCVGMYNLVCVSM